MRDDITCHCRSEQEAQQLQTLLTQRFNECGLHPVKTKIVYCKSWKNTSDHDQISFDFLGFTFRPRLSKLKSGILLVCFLPAISQPLSESAQKSTHGRGWVQCEIKDIIRYSQSKLRGWMTYYGAFGRGLIKHVLFDQKLNAWAKRKYKSLKTTMHAARRVKAFRSRNPKLVAHW